MRIALRRLLAAALLLGVAALAQPAGSETQQAREMILGFYTKLFIRPNSSVTVTETIEFTSYGREVRHGLKRGLPLSFQDSYGVTVRVSYEFLSVTRDGRPEPYELREENGEKVLYLGSPGSSLAPGEHTYVLRYRALRRLEYFQTYDALAWQVTGHDWHLPIRQAGVALSPPSSGRFLSYKAYAGKPGARGKAVRVRTLGSGRLVVNATRALTPGEGLSVAVTWPKGLVREPTAKEYFRE